RGAHRDLHSFPTRRSSDLHARVVRATVTISLTPNEEVQIVVADEGVGFDPADVLSPTRPSTGWGLLSIRERATLLGGRFDIDSRSEEHTSELQSRENLVCR